MRKLYHSYRCQGEKGFTLVEILVAMVILLLIVTACFPLFTMATKTTYENRVRMIAGELAKQEIERTLAEVTASNYISEDADAPLRTTGSDLFNDISGHPGYKMKKTVEWVDDPDDGIYPTDKIPFDYKQLIVEVSYPSMFEGSITNKADFKTFVAREGTASPTVGLVVKVNNLIDTTPSTEAVSGAHVNITNLATGDEDSANTNENGFAFFKVEIPDDISEYTFEVSVESSGLIMDPNPAHLNRQIVPRDESSEITIDMAEPASITVKCKTPVAPGRLELIGGNSDSSFDITESDLAGSSITKSFKNLWPFTAYELNAHIPVHRVDFTSASVLSNFEESPADDDNINIWNFVNSADWVGWVAKPDSTVSNYYENNLLKYLVDLSDYSPGDTSVQIQKAIMTPISESMPIFALDAGSEADSFIILQMNRSSDSHDLDNPVDWITVTNLGDLSESTDLTIALPKPEVVLSDSFALRLASTPNITNFAIRDFYIVCDFAENVTFNSPGEDYTVNLTQ